MAGTCEGGNEPSVSVKCGEFLYQLQNQLASQEGLCSMELVSEYRRCGMNSGMGSACIKHVDSEQ